MVQNNTRSPPRRPKKPPTKPQDDNETRKASQDRPKIDQKASKRASKMAQQGSESIQEGPKMAEHCFKTAAEAPKKGGDIQELRLLKQGTELERVVNSTSFQLCCCAGAVAGFAAGSWISVSSNGWYPYLVQTKPHASGIQKQHKRQHNE